MTAVELSKTYAKPSLIIFSSLEPISEPSVTPPGGLLWNFGTGGSTLYITDDNRSPLSIVPQRLESKRRMIDGTMRSVHIADKMTFSTSWESLPSRKTRPTPGTPDGLSNKITSDSFGAGQDIKDWYEANFSDFWMLLVYDASVNKNEKTNVEKYNVFFDDFDFSIVKRGQHNDLWDVSISLVEV
jgi:hypothetical protein